MCINPLAGHNFDENQKPASVPEQTVRASLEYLKLGFYSIPLPPGEKGPKCKEWQKLRLDEVELQKRFGQSPQNIGLLLGQPSGGLTDVDLDCPETVKLAPEFLPPTTRTSGRASKPLSHLWYTCKEGKPKKFEAPDGKTLVEIRSTGGQTMVPPSVHPSGELCIWHEEGEPTPIARNDLEAAVAHLAAAALLAQVWNKKGSRHKIALASSGLLLRGGLSEEAVKKIISFAARAAGDEEEEDRIRTVESTAARIRAKEPVTGGPTANELIGEEVVKRLRKWLNLRSTPEDIPKGESQRGPSQAATLVRMAEDCELFHSPAGESFASFKVREHMETWPIRSKKFRTYLASRFYKEHDKVPGSQAVQDCLGVVEAKAQIEGPEKTLWHRVAEHEGALYLDLVNESWEAVRITQEGWSVVKDCPVKFRRAKGMLPLPTPERGGSVSDLRTFLNAPDDHAWTLHLAWLLSVFRPTGPFPVLALNGEQGCAKSTDTRVLRELIDPNEAGLRSEPRDERDLVIAANNSWVIVFDNLSRIKPWLSDALCRLSTGGGFATRELYSDAEEAIFKFQRPCIINGIEELVTRSDLLDRTVLLTLPPIAAECRRPEKVFWAEFYAIRPRLLGALLDAVSGALGKVSSVTLIESPRMADFAIWATAGEEALGLRAGAFMEAYAGNREEGHSLALDASPVAKAVRELMERESWWQGTATDLQLHLAAYGGNEPGNRVGWPKDARGLSNALQRVAPNLREIGIDVQRSKKDRNTRLITITRIRR